MISKIVDAKPIPAAQLRRMFEQSVEGITNVDAPTPRVRYGAPIVDRKLFTAETPVNGGKRALSDAARALAMLWKLPVTVR